MALAWCWNLSPNIFVVMLSNVIFCRVVKSYMYNNTDNLINGFKLDLKHLTGKSLPAPILNYFFKRRFKMVGYLSSIIIIYISVDLNLYLFTNNSLILSIYSLITYLLLLILIFIFSNYLIALTLLVWSPKFIIK